MAKQRLNPGVRIHRPPINTNDDLRLAYGLECARIWWEGRREEDATGKEVAIWTPTFEEFREARRIIRSRRLYRGDK